MRPPGEIRQVLGTAVQETGGGTWRELAQRTCVGFSAAKVTLRNMARAGEIAAGGTVRVPGVCRPMIRYEPAAPTPSAPDPLLAIVRSWAEFT